MRSILYCISMILLCQACDKNQKIDWREKFEGTYDGQGVLKSWIFERVDTWVYTANIRITKSSDAPDKFLIQRGKVETYFPRSEGYSYFQTNLGLIGSIDLLGGLTIPSQSLSAENEFASVTIAERKQNFPAHGSYGTFSGDSLLLVIAFSNKDMRDSMIVHRR